MATTKERPVSCTSNDVHAILRDLKSQMRHVVVPTQLRTKNVPPRPRNVPLTMEPRMINGEQDTDDDGALVWRGNHPSYLCGWKWFTCPYGAPGHRLWVREAWQAWKEFDTLKAGELPDEMHSRLNYPANGNVWDARLRPSIHMPRWASRITLEITDVRVEQLQNISVADIRAEGIEKTFIDVYGDMLIKFRNSWNSINAKRGYGWETNPWVWVITFKRIIHNSNAV